MTILSKVLVAIAAASVSGAASFGQTPASVKPSVVAGDVVSVSETTIVLRAKDGDVTAIISDKTEYKQIPPDNPVLKAAVAASRADIGVGDKVLVTGILAEDKRSLPARSVYLMTKAAIAKRDQTQAEKWRTRGISGKITAVNLPANQVTIEVRGLANSTSVVVTPAAGARFLRYAPNSVKYSEAVASKLSDLAAGDMLRAVGDKNADGTQFSAEEIVSGAFQTVAGTVKSVDVAQNQLVITNFQTKKDVLIDLSQASVLKKFPEEMAIRMAQFQGAAAGASIPPQSAAAGSRPAGGFGGQRGGVDDMIERFPNITTADIKAGDVIAVSSTKTDVSDRITAIKLVAGVEPFIRIAQASAASGGRRGSRGGQADGGFTIPGLDGFGGE